ncbi:hypothetical protein Mame01_49930 [Microbispora amethystogenes]|nr:hypothetical protein Mame01_49930 [Microbispora amethystogenes]
MDNSRDARTSTDNRCQWSGRTVPGMAFIHKITRPLGPIAADGRYHDDQRGRASEPGDGSPDRGDHLAGARPEGAGR